MYGNRKGVFCTKGKETKCSLCEIFLGIKLGQGRISLGPRKFGNPGKVKLDPWRIVK